MKRNKITGFVVNFQYKRYQISLPLSLFKIDSLALNSLSCTKNLTLSEQFDSLFNNFSVLSHSLHPL